MNYLTTGKVLAYLAIIFMAGGATGAVIVRNAHEHQVQPTSLEKTCHRFQNRLVSKLSLTQEQVKKLQPVFDETAQELRAVHARAIQHTDEIIRKAHQQIARELTPEQKAKLEQFDQERQQWLRQRLNEQAQATE